MFISLLRSSPLSVDLGQGDNFADTGGKKGRVESGVGYLRHNLLPTLQSRDVGDVADQLRRWTEQTANQRIHGTTGRRPAEAFEADERKALLPLPARPYRTVMWK